MEKVLKILSAVTAFLIAAGEVLRQANQYNASKLKGTEVDGEDNKNDELPSTT